VKRAFCQIVGHQTSSPTSKAPTRPLLIADAMAERECLAVLCRGPVASWDARVRALRDVRRLARAGCHELRVTLSSYGRPLALAVADLRSAVVREAFGCIEDLAASYKAEFTRAICDVLLPALLKSAANSVTFLASSAADTAQSIIREGALGVSKRSVILLANSVMGKVGEIRSAASRRSAAKCLGLLLQDEVLSSLVSTAAEAIEQAILAGCTESDVEVRNISRDNWRKLETLQPNSAAKLLDKLPGQTQCLILKEKDAAMAEPLSLTPEKCIGTRKGKRESPLRDIVENIGALRAPQRSSLALAMAPLVPSPPPNPMHARAGPRRANPAQSNAVAIANPPPKSRPRPPPAPRRLPHAPKFGSDSSASKASDLSFSHGYEHVPSNPFAHRPPRRSILPMKSHVSLKSHPEVPANTFSKSESPENQPHEEPVTDDGLGHLKLVGEAEIRDRAAEPSSPTTPPAQSKNSLRKARISFILGPNLSPVSDPARNDLHIICDAIEGCVAAVEPSAL
jgi:hypothetical protein